MDCECKGGVEENEGEGLMDCFAIYQSFFSSFISQDQFVYESRGLLCIVLQ